MRKVEMSVVAVENCIKELKALGFSEVLNKDEFEGMISSGDSRIWNYHDREVSYIVLYKPSRNTWDLYAYSVDNWQDNYDYLLVAKPEGPAFRVFFDNFKNALREKNKKRKTRIISHVRK